MEFSRNFQLLETLRQAGIASEIYPEAAKMKKQFEYADKKAIPYVLVMGTNEIAENVVSLKDMRSGTQEKVEITQLVNRLNA